MCLLICARLADGSLVLAVNRDERYDRPSRPPELWPTALPLLAGRDERAGGTWLAVNAAGVLAAVTNRPTVDGDQPQRPSRGKLPLLACVARSARAARDALLIHLEHTRYNGFNLFLADGAESFILQAPGPRPQHELVPPGLHLLGNAGWDDAADARLERARTLLGRLAGAGQGPLPVGPEALRHLPPDPPAVMDRLCAVCRDHGEEGARHALCVHGQIGGTVSSTVLLLKGRLRTYLHADGPPCRTPYQSLPLPEAMTGA